MHNKDFVFHFVYMFVSLWGFVLGSGSQRPGECIESPGVGDKGSCERSTIGSGSKLGSSSGAVHSCT